jgi:hypothetical protein
LPRPSTGLANRILRSPPVPGTTGWRFGPSRTAVWRVVRSLSLSPSDVHARVKPGSSINLGHSLGSNSDIPSALLIPTKHTTQSHKGQLGKRGRESLTRGEKGTGVINSRVNRADGTKELESQRRSVQHGGPYGSELCSQQIFALLGLESSLRLRGRPRKPLRSPEIDSRPLLLDIAGTNPAEAERLIGQMTWNSREG